MRSAGERHVVVGHPRQEEPVGVGGRRSHGRLPLLRCRLALCVGGHVASLRLADQRRRGHVVGELAVAFESRDPLPVLAVSDVEPALRVAMARAGRFDVGDPAGPVGRGGTDVDDHLAPLVGEFGDGGFRREPLGVVGPGQDVRGYGVHQRLPGCAEVVGGGGRHLHGDAVGRRRGGVRDRSGGRRAGVPGSRRRLGYGDEEPGDGEGGDCGSHRQCGEHGWCPFRT